MLFELAWTDTFARHKCRCIHSLEIPRGSFSPPRFLYPITVLVKPPVRNPTPSPPLYYVLLRLRVPLKRVVQTDRRGEEEGGPRRQRAPITAGADVSRGLKWGSKLENRNAQRAVEGPAAVQRDLWFKGRNGRRRLVGWMERGETRTGCDSTSLGGSIRFHLD